MDNVAMAILLAMYPVKGSKNDLLLEKHVSPPRPISPDELGKRLATRFNVVRS